MPGMKKKKKSPLGSEVCALQLLVKYVNYRLLCPFNVVLVSTFMQEITHLHLKNNFHISLVILEQSFALLEDWCELYCYLLCMN